MYVLPLLLSDTASEHLVVALVLQNDVILGVNALDVPRLARNVRQDYKASRVTNKILVTKCLLLLLCPDHATAWADRGRHLQSDDDEA